VLDALGARVLRIDPASGPGTDVTDLEGRYAQWFEELAADTVIVRPDFYVYAAVDASELAPRLRELAAQLSLEVRASSSPTTGLV